MALKGYMYVTAVERHVCGHGSYDGLTVMPGQCSSPEFLNMDGPKCLKTGYMIGMYLCMYVRP